MKLLEKVAAKFRRHVLGRRPPLSPWAALGREYDQQTIEVFRRVLHRDSNCLDIGAHRGCLLKHLLRFAPSGQQHAFEPIPQYAALLRKKYPRAVVHEVALADAPGRASFCYVENAPAWSGLRPRVYEVEDPRIQPLEVEVARADDLLPPDLRVSLVKLDIEGGEYHALLGTSRTLERDRPYIVFEAGQTSTGQYGVTPDDLYSLIVDRFHLKLSTMYRWLQSRSPYTREEFQANWRQGPDFYFLAYPD